MWIYIYIYLINAKWRQTGNPSHLEVAREPSFDLKKPVSAKKFEFAPAKCFLAAARDSL